MGVPYKQTTKTAAGSRVLVVPEQRMVLIRVAIDAFHTDPDTGQVDTAARLVPGLQTPDRSGQHPYRHAFTEAAIAEQLSGEHRGFSVSTHLLRKSLATVLAWSAGIEDAFGRRFMGHRAGDDIFGRIYVFGRIYTLDHPDVAPETDSSGARFVTRTSVEQYWLARQQRGRPAEQLEATALGEVARATGQS